MLTKELVHFAVDDIYAHYGKIGMESRVALLQKYQDNAPSDDERFWAHQSLVNSLSCLEKNQETTEEHTRLYRWTCKNMSDKHVLEVMSNLNAANCWKDDGRIDEWIQLYDEASERLDNSKVSDYSRCDFLQIGAEVLRHNERFDEALLGLEKLEQSNKDQDWEHYFRFWLLSEPIRS